MTEIVWMDADDWGMWWDGDPRREALRDQEAYVHHIGGAAWMDYAPAVDVFRALNQYAIEGKGYSALDYDILVHYHRAHDVLTIAEGRGPWMSAATLRRNEEGEAIVLCGNTHKRKPLDIELDGIALGIVQGIKKGWLRPDALILGHRDNRAFPNGQATACPGQYLYSQMQTVRGRVAKLLGPAPEPSPDPPPLPPPMKEAFMSDVQGPYLVAKTVNGAYWFGTPAWRRHAGSTEQIDLWVDLLPCVDVGTGKKPANRYAVTEVADSTLNMAMGARID